MRALVQPSLCAVLDFPGQPSTYAYATRATQIAPRRFRATPQVVRQFNLDLRSAPSQRSGRVDPRVVPQVVEHIERSSDPCWTAFRVAFCFAGGCERARRGRGDARCGREESLPPASVSRPAFDSKQTGAELCGISDD